jgi:hypothetical protein
MATSPMSAYRVAEATIPVRVSVVTFVPRIEPTTLDADIDDGCGAARGILFGVLLCAPFWVGVSLMVFAGHGGHGRHGRLMMMGW